MKITNLTTFLLPWGSLFVKVDTDEGISGWGECSPMNGRVIQSMLVYSLKPLIIGKNPVDTEVIWEEMLLRPYKLGPSGIHMEAVSGIDIALWDIKGKLSGQPIYQLLGGSFRDRVQIYYSSGWDKRSTAEVAAAYAQQAEKGFKHFKIRMN